MRPLVIGQSVSQATYLRFHFSRGEINGMKNDGIIEGDDEGNGQDEPEVSKPCASLPPCVLQTVSCGDEAPELDHLFYALFLVDAL
ncbi:hypothetical protein E2C01_033771 [Portunus trituberculatus]|uniref:Uncharacterized protein n=1 Tax=Portunus trituberculatus TaxID=210409 RepID=A0A5B7F3K7_PORTR|nr:hypothetical protein [Portunus trituberculatus]